PVVSRCCSPILPVDPVGRPLSVAASISSVQPLSSLGPSAPGRQGSNLPPATQTQSPRPSEVSVSYGSPLFSEIYQEIRGQAPTFCATSNGVCRQDLTNVQFPTRNSQPKWMSDCESFSRKTRNSGEWLRLRSKPLGLVRPSSVRIRIEHSE